MVITGRLGLEVMFDPTRIDRTLAALRAAWEGQPDLPLGTLFGMLAAEGYGWGVPDDELTARLESIAAVHPPLVPLDANLVTEGLWLVITPSHRVTLAPQAPTASTSSQASTASASTQHRANIEPTSPSDCAAVVQPVSKEGQRGQPVAWRVSALRPVGPGRPLVITDAEGFEHRFGVVESVTRLREDHRALSDLKRRSVGTACGSSAPTLKQSSSTTACTSSSARIESLSEPTSPGTASRRGKSENLSVSTSHAERCTRLESSRSSSSPSLSPGVCPLRRTSQRANPGALPCPSFAFAHCSHCRYRDLAL